MKKTRSNSKLQIQRAVNERLEARCLLSTSPTNAVDNQASENALILTLDSNAGPSVPTATAPTVIVTPAEVAGTPTNRVENATAEDSPLTQNVVGGPVDVGINKMASDYQEVFSAVVNGYPSPYYTRIDDQNRLETYVTTESESNIEVTELLTQLGAKIDGYLPLSHVLSAWIPIDRIDHLANQNSVSKLSLPDYGQDRAEQNGTRPSDLNVSDDLWYAIQAKLDNSTADGARFDSDGRIQVYIRVAAELFELVSTEIESSRGLIDVTAPKMGVIQAWLPADAIVDLAKSRGVSQITLPDYSVHSTGSVNSAGDALLEANDARTIFGTTGSGVKVGVISDGVDHKSSVGSDLGTVTVDPTYPGSGDEGTAMLEIIQDLAPSASLYFSGPKTSVEYLNAVNWLVSQNCDVIVDDVGYYGEAYFGDTDVAAAAQSAVANGITYITAAGNGGSDNNATTGIFHYQANFDGTTVHDFDPSASTDTTMSFQISAGAKIRIVLQWSDGLFSSSNDYNLDLLDSGGGVLRSSSVVQNGNDTPVESIQYTNSSGAIQTVGLRVSKVSTAATREIELFSLLSSDTPANTYIKPLQYVTRTDALIGQQALPDVVTATAIDSSDPGTDDIESFASRGGSTIYTNFTTQSKVIRNSLDIAGIDNVVTRVGQLGYFANPFNGTSAAAPHIAGIAALMLQAEPGLTPAELQSDLQKSSDDIGAIGYDSTSGYGRADAAQAVLRALVTDSGGVITIDGTTGNDTISTSLSGSTLSVTCNGIVQTFDATGVTGLVINGADGNDSITVGSGIAFATTLSGGNGNDTLTGGIGADSLIGGANDDDLSGGQGNDTLAGGQGNDALGGGQGDDSLTGGDGNDAITGGAQNDRYVFGTTTIAQTDVVIETGATDPFDALDFNAMTTAVVANLQIDSSIASMTNRTINTGATGQAANFEFVYGGSAGDSITGNAAANSLSGNSGNDTIGGSTNNDTIGGGPGFDVLTGGQGNDLINGGGDNDTIFSNDGLVDTVDGGTGTDSLTSDAGLDVVSNVP